MSVTFPVFVTRNEYATASPAAATVVGDADFTTEIDGDCVTVTNAESLSVTAAPTGGVPDAVAVFATEPASTSACVTRYEAVHVVDAPGANDGDRARHRRQTRQRIGDTDRGERHVARVRHHERIRHRITRSRTVVGAADFTTEIDGDCVTVTNAESLSVTAAPTGGVPDAVAVFATEPASTSACDTRYEAVHVVDAPGANDATGHDHRGQTRQRIDDTHRSERHVARVRHHERIRHRITRRRHRHRHRRLDHRDRRRLRHRHQRRIVIGHRSTHRRRTARRRRVRRPNPHPHPPATPSTSPYTSSTHPAPTTPPDTPPPTTPATDRPHPPK